MLTAGHARQRSHWLTLRAGSHQHDLVGCHASGLVHLHNGIFRRSQQPQFLRDAHVANHRATVEGNLAASLNSCVDDRLHAVDIRCEGRDDNALLGIHNQAAQSWSQLRLGSREARNRSVGGLTQEEVNSLITVAAQRRQVSRLSVRRSLVHLHVTGVDDHAGSGLNDDAKALRNRVVDIEETQIERATLNVAGVVDLDDLRALTVFLCLGLNQCQGKARSNNRDVRALLEQPRDSTDVVLVTVGDHESFHAIPLVFHVGEVRQDQVNTRLIRAREQHAAVDDNQAVLVLQHGHIATDFGNTAQCNHAQAVLGGLRRCRKTLGQVCTLHRLDYVTTVATASATATPRTISAITSTAAATTAGTAVGRIRGTLGLLSVTGVLTLTGTLRGLRAVGFSSTLVGALGCRVIGLLCCSHVGLGRRTSLTSYLAGAIASFSHYRTPAFRIASSSTSSCWSFAAICGKRGSPISMPCRRRADLAKLTPPSAA